jgi:KDO2-lipid IV(A) lauroyltransferase
LLRLVKAMPGAFKLAGLSEATVLRGFWLACRQMSPEQASAFGEAVLRRIGPRTRQHRKVLLNLSTAFPEWSEARVRAAAAGVWGNFGRVLAEYPHIDRIAGENSWRAHVEVISRFDVSKSGSRARPAILVSGHFGNWELPAAVAARVGLPISVVYSGQDNTAVDAALQSWRRALACRFIEKDTSVHTLVAEIRNGRSLGILMDQRYDIGDSVPFFGHDAPVAIAPATLAARLDLPFVPVRVVRLEGCRFRLEVEEPIEPDRSLGNARAIARDMTARLYRRYETWISEYPEQWLCIKRRWPDLRKRKWQAKLASNPRLVSSPRSAPPG